MNLQTEMQQKTNSIEIQDREMPPKNQKSNFQIIKETKLKMDEVQCSVSIERLKNKERDLWIEIEKLSVLAKNQPYMEFKDYFYARQFFSSNFQQLKQFYRQTEQNVIQTSSSPQSKVTSTHDNDDFHLKINEAKVVHQSHQTSLASIQLKYYDLFHIGLVLAKSFFITNQFQKCHDTILMFVPLEVKITFKLLYERQALLFKTIFILYRSQKQAVVLLKNVLKQYAYFKDKCLDWQNNKNIASIYDAVLQDLFKKAYESFIIADSIDHRELPKFIQAFLSSCANSNQVLFPGFPVYLVSNNWIKRAKQYLKQPDVSKYPGSIFNFQLLNHLFEFEGHVTQDKFYMDTVLFPFTQNIDFTVVSAKAWKQICLRIGGYPIKRFPSEGKNFKNQLISDTLVKTLLSINDKLFLFQWQAGTYWQHSILPYLNQKYFKSEGLGQMKYLQQRVNKRNQSYQEVDIVRPGIIQQKKCLYRYYQINPKLRKRIGKQRLSKLNMKYDLEDYFIREQRINSYSLAIIGIHNIKESVKKFFQQLEIQKIIGNQKEKNQQKTKMNSVISSEIASASEYLACIIHCISNLPEIVTLFVTNQYATYLKTESKEHNLQFCIAFAHLLKHMWFSDFRKDSVDASCFIKALLHNKTMQKTGKEGNKQEDMKMVEEIILYLHMILNSGEGTKQILKFSIYSSIQPLISQCIPFFQKINNSPICKIFKQYHYQIFSCIHCTGVIGYKLIPTLTLDVNVPDCHEYLNMYFVSSSKIRKGRFDVNSNSGKCLLKQPIFMKDKEEKFVQEINFKLLKRKTIAHVYNLMAEKYKLDLSNPSIMLITMIIDEHAENFQIIYTSKDMGKRDVSISWINNILHQNNQAERIRLGKTKQKQSQGYVQSKTIILFTFLITEPMETKQLFIATFRSCTKQKQINGFPQIIKIPKLNNYELQRGTNQKGKQLLRGLISDPQIQIQKFEVKQLKNNILGAGDHTIKKKIIIYTNSRLWLVQRTLNYLLIEQKQIGVHQNQCLTLEECLKMRYDDHSGELVVDKPKEQLTQEDVTCYQCKKAVKAQIKRRILELNQTLTISIVRDSQKNGIKPRNMIKFPLKGLNMTALMNKSSKKQINYNLRAAILSQKKQLNSKQMYYCLAQNCVNNKWYEYRNESVKQVDICKIDTSGAEILFYERETTENKQES